MNDKLTDATLLKVVFDALNSALSGVALTRLDGSFSWANQAFLDMFGYQDVDDAIGNRLSDHFASGRLQHVGGETSAMDSIHADSDVIEFKMHDSDGAPFYVMMSISDIRDETGDVIGGMVTVNDISRRIAAEEALKQSRGRIRFLSKRFVSAQETERKRIARELHDSVGSSLTALKFSIEQHFAEKAAATEDAGLAVEDIVGRVQQLIGEVQRISQNLRPSILDDLGFEAAIRSYCREVAQGLANTSIDAHLAIQGDAIPEELQIVIYRIVQESIANAAKHGSAEKITVTIDRRGTEIHLTVADNGSGFDPKTLPVDHSHGRQGLGLNSMRERAEIYGGHFELDAGPGRGVTIRCAWPIGDDED